MSKLDEKCLNTNSKLNSILDAEIIFKILKKRETKWGQNNIINVGSFLSNLNKGI